MREDRLLLRRLRQGDQDALGRIYEKYKDTLLTVAVSLVGDLSAAEDCLHDAFVAFAGNAANLRVRSSLRGYLVACVANRARDELRKDARSSALLDHGDVRDDAPDPVTLIVDHEESSQVFAALAELPYEQREVVVLHLEGGMKFREIARHQGVSTNTALSRYRYALNKLRVLLSEGGSHDAP